MRVHRGSLGLVVLAAALAACLPQVVRNPTVFRAAAPEQQPYVVVGETASVSPSVGSSGEVRKGSRWRRIGSTEQGDVYKPVGEIFMLTSQNAHEAYLVVSGRTLVGFYLPGERAFAPAREQFELQLQ